MISKQSSSLHNESYQNQLCKNNQVTDHKKIHTHNSRH